MLEINKYLTLKIRERRQSEHKYIWEWKKKRPKLIKTEDEDLKAISTKP